MLKTQKVFWWRTGCANTEGKLGKEPDGEMGSLFPLLGYHIWERSKKDLCMA